MKKYVRQKILFTFFKVYGKPIANSNIVDLINDTVRGRKKSEPSGWQTFAQNLKESNVPRDYVGKRSVGITCMRKMKKKKKKKKENCLELHDRILQCV